jgi:hypothetical protein
MDVCSHSAFPSGGAGSLEVQAARPLPRSIPTRSIGRKGFHQEEANGNIEYVLIIRGALGVRFRFSTDQRY